MLLVVINGRDGAADAHLRVKIDGSLDPQEIFTLWIL